MTTEWVIREEGQREIRQDAKYSLEEAVALAKKWIHQREEQGYNVSISTTRPTVPMIWGLTHSSLIPITISISEWD